MQFSYATTTSEAEWREWVTDNAAVEHGGIRLATRPAIHRSALRDRVRDLATGPDGDVYLLGVAGGVYRHDPATESRERLLAPTDDALGDPRAICAGENRVFVADDDGSIVAVTPALRRPIGTLRPDVPVPSAMAYEDGTLYAVAGGELVGVDREGTARARRGQCLENPVDVAVRDGVTYVLDRGSEAVVRAFGADGATLDPFPLGEAAFVAGGTAFDPVRLTVVEGAVVVAGAFDGRSDHALFEWDLESGRFEHVTALDGPVDALAGRAGDGDGRRFHAVVGDDRTCYALPEVREYAPHDGRDRRVGTALHRYDSGTEDLQWHRLQLGIVRSSASTQVRLRYVATDDPGLVELTAEAVDGLEPAAARTLREAGVRTVWQLVASTPSELASLTPDLDADRVADWQRAARRALAHAAEDGWTLEESVDPEDVLLDDARGRYLFVAVELVGTRDASPLVDSVRAYCPRSSYLRYMPDVYRSDEESAAFLERFLSVFETSFNDVEAEIESITELFDPDAVPTEALSWLEEWLAVDPGEEWPESARRELLARAPELYRKRGTRAGLVALVDLYLRHADPAYKGGLDGGEAAASAADAAPGPAAAATDGSERSAGRRLFFLDRTDLDPADDGAAVEAYDAHLADDRSFAVFSDAFDSAADREAVEAIIDAERPAHVDGRLVVLEDEFTLGDSTFLGVNSELSTREFVLDEVALGKDTVLTPRDAAE